MRKEARGQRGGVVVLWCCGGRAPATVDCWGAASGLLQRPGS